MPKVRVGDIEIYYEIHGEEHPITLTMVRGLGSNLTAWYEQTPVMARNFRTLVFDNRGVGRTDKPDMPYSIPRMAADVAGLLDALDIRRTALLGISMGGMIAQEFALNYQNRLSCLILGCTTFGGSQAVQPSPEMIAAITAGVSADVEVIRQQERAIFCEETLTRRLQVKQKYYEARAIYPTPPHGLARQMAAIMTYDASPRLSVIKVQTLVMTGNEDRLVPPENSRLIAGRITGATLKELPGGHLFFTEYPELFNQALIDFVKSNN